MARRQLFSVVLGETDIAIDCGAHVGLITEFFSQSNARVYAFEPNPYAFQVLQEKFRQHANVMCLQQGVLDCNATLRLYLHELAEQDQVRWAVSSSLLDFKGNIRKDSYVDVEVIDLCEFILSLKARIKVLKMDVEGVEGRILQKLIDTDVIRLVDHVFVETHERKIPALRSEIKKLRRDIRKKRLQHINLDWQ
jgi:FkbM family methyltransferase